MAEDNSGGSTHNQEDRPRAREVSSSDTKQIRSLSDHNVHSKMKLSRHAFAFVMSRRAFSLLIILVLALLGGAGGIAFTCRPQFCSYCHEMDQDYSSWQTSTHRNVNCISCHVEPGLYNLVKDKMTTGVKSLVLKITGNYEKPINGDSSLSEEMQNDVCDQCHTAAIRKSTSFRGVIMNHEAHLKTKLTCATCHNRVAHKIKGYKDRVTEEFCFECHNGKVLSQECSLCHTPEFLKQNERKTKK